MNSPNRTCRVLDHSGDLEFEACGQDCLEALAHASSGLVDQIVPLSQIAETEELYLTVTADTDTDRIIAFLNEILYLVYTRHWLPRRVRTLQQCHRQGCKEFEAVLIGEPFDSARHEIRHDIKAVTYHGFQLRTEGELTIIRFVCDL